MSFYYYFLSPLYPCVVYIVFYIRCNSSNVSLLFVPLPSLLWLSEVHLTWELKYFKAVPESEGEASSVGTAVMLWVFGTTKKQMNCKSGRDDGEFNKQRAGLWFWIKDPKLQKHRRSNTENHMGQKLEHQEEQDTETGMLANEKD